MDDEPNPVENSLVGNNILIDRKLSGAKECYMQNLRWGVIWRYLGAILLGNLVWEIAQLPLYTIWKTGTARELAVAVFHCTAADVAIAAGAVVIALVLTREWNWPRNGFHKVVCIAIAIGIAYTIYSERLNVLVRHNWSYADLMPVLHWFEVGLSPVMQWLLVPSAAFGWARKVIGMGRR